MQQFTNLIEFRQTVYDRVLTRARDAQFELVDALLLSAPIHTFPELSCSPIFRRQWHSAYAAIENGRQDREWLERYLVQLLPTEGCLVFSLDGTSWPHTAARTMSDRQYVYSASSTGLRSPVVVGHPYSVLAWAPERNTSWAPPLSIRRTPSQKTDVEVGVDQVKQLCRDRGTEMIQSFHLIVADGKYGNHSFLGPLKEELCGALARMRCDRVLYQAPGEYSGRGTILVDLERRRPVDLLPDRTAKSLANWLKAHPGVEIISSDRSREYGKGIAGGAPEAIQVADRWHLLQNLKDALVRALEQNQACLYAAANEPERNEEAQPKPISPVQPMRPGDRCLTKAELRRQATRERRLERYNTVMELHQGGMSIRAMARELGMGRGTVRRYLNAGSFPEMAERKRQPSILDPYLPYLESRWAEGYQNAMQLFRDIEKQGYSGSPQTVNR